MVLGDVGAEKYLEFTIIGDTVNIASRLQQVTREFQCDMVVSQELVSQVKEERAGDQNQSLLLDQLSPRGHINLRGRSGSVEVFTHTCKQ